MFICQIGNDTPTRRPRKESLFDEERFIDFLQGSHILANGRSNGTCSYRTAAELVDDGKEDLVVDGVEPARVDVQRIEREAGDFQIDDSVSAYLCKIPDPAQERICDTRRAPAPQGYLACRLIFNVDFQDAGTASGSSSRDPSEPSAAGVQDIAPLTMDQGKVGPDPALVALMDRINLALEDANSACTAGQGMRVAEAAHRIAQDCDAFSFRILARIARCVEQAGKAGDINALHDLLPELSNQIERNNIALRQLR